MYEIKLTLFAIFSILMASQSNRQVFFSDTGKRILTFWIGILPFIFIVRSEILNMVMYVVLLVALERNNRTPILSLMFFIGVLGAVPDWSAYVVSVPGINYLIKLTFDKLAVIALLLPIALTLSRYKIKWHVTDTLVCAFVFFMVVLTFREGKLTTVLRFVVDTSIAYLIPYFVFTRVVRSINDLHYCALGFLILAVLVASLFIVSQAVRVDIYAELNPYNSFHFLREYRLGFLRLSGPFNGVLVGFLLLSGYLAFDVLKKQSFLCHIPSWIFLSICVLCVFFGGSRGALFGFVLGLGLYFYFVKLAGAKRTAVTVVFFCLCVLEWMFDLTSLLNYEDEYGTFDYRAELYEASWTYLQSHFLWGSPYYLESGHFNHLVTGLGIIDIVSAYLQVALRYGVVTLVIFVGMFLSVMVPLFNRVRQLKDMTSDIARYAAMYLSLNVVMMFLISTTSMISLFPIFIVMNIAIGRVILTSDMLKKAI